MARFIDITGNRYGRLVVIRQQGRASDRQILWLCQCDCGKLTTARGYDLRRGQSKSCGCLKRDLCSLPSGDAALNHLMGTYRRQAARRGLQWELGRAQFAKLTARPCHYCGAAPAQVAHYEGYNGDYIYNGIDRKDNGRGYTPNNCVASCGQCNRNKGAMDYQAFLDWITRVCSYRETASA